MALMSHLVFFLLSVQCSLQYWPQTNGHATNSFGQEGSATIGNSWRNQKENTKGDINTIKDNKPHWFINQVPLNNNEFRMSNAPVLQNPTLSTEQNQQRINYRWINGNTNGYTQPEVNSWFEPSIPDGGNKLANGWYKVDPTSQQMNSKPTVQPNENTNSWNNGQVSDIVLSNWDVPKPLSNGNSLDNGKQETTNNPWNQVAMSGNQVLNSPVMQDKPVMEDNAFFNTPLELNSQSAMIQHPILYSWMEVPVELNKLVQILSEENEYTNAKPENNIRSGPKYNLNIPLSENRTPKKVPSETLQAEFNSGNSPFDNNYIIVPKMNNKPDAQSNSNKNAWSQMRNQETDQSGWYTKAILGSGGNMNSKSNFQTSSTVNTWKPTHASKNGPFNNVEQNVWNSLKPEQTNKPKMQVNSNRMPWDQVSGNWPSVWYSNTNTVPSENKPVLDAKPNLQSNSIVNTWNQFASGDQPSIWNNKEQNQEEQNNNYKLQPNFNVLTWNQVSQDAPTGWYSNTNSVVGNNQVASNIQSEEQSNFNENSWNQLVSRTEPSTWYNNVPVQNQAEQNSKPEMQANSKVTAWNQILSEQIPSGWYRNTKAVPMKNEPVMYGIPKSQVNPNINQWNIGNCVKSSMQEPSPYLMVPQVSQSHKMVATPKSETSSFYNINLNNGMNIAPN